MFLAHHRWKLLAAVLSVVVVGTIAFAAQLQVRLWQLRVEERSAREKQQAEAQAARAKQLAEVQAARAKQQAEVQAAREKQAEAQAADEVQAREVINAMTSFRGALMELTAFCGTHDVRSIPPCMDRFRIFADQYHRLSWYAPPRLLRLRATQCSMADPKSKSIACSVFDAQEQSPKWDLVDCMDRSFTAVVGAFTTGNDLGQRCASAMLLYEHGRRLGCVINWLSFGPIQRTAGPTSSPRA